MYKDKNGVVMCDKKNLQFLCLCLNMIFILYICGGNIISGLSHPFLGQGPGPLCIGKISDILGKVAKNCTPFKRGIKPIFSFRFSVILKNHLSFPLKSLIFELFQRTCLGSLLRSKCKCYWEFFNIKLGIYITFLPLGTGPIFGPNLRGVMALNIIIHVQCIAK